MVKIAAFDLATVTGAAIGAETEAPFTFTEKLGDPGSDHGARFLQCSLVVSRIIKEHRPDLIAIEEPIASGPAGDKNRAFVLIGLRAAVALVAWHREVAFVEYPPGAVRSYFLGQMAVGKRRAALKDMLVEHCASYGWSVDNDDEADAVALWAYAMYRQGHDLCPRKYGAMI